MNTFRHFDTIVDTGHSVTHSEPVAMTVSQVVLIKLEKVGDD